MSDFEVYDPATNTWTTKASLPVEKAVYGGVAAIGGTIYAISGHDTSAAVNTMYAYDTATNTWTAKAPAPTSRYAAHWAVAVYGRIYVLGGNVDGGVTKLVESYDPATDTWSAARGMGTVRSYLCAAAIGNTIYAIGGHDGSSLLSSVEAGWVPGLPMATAPAAHLAAALSVSPAISATGETVTVRLTVTNTGSGAANTVAPAIRVSAGASLVTLAAGPAPANVASLAAGAAATFVYTYTTSTGAGGSVQFSATGSGTDAGTAAVVSAQATAGLTVTYNPPSATPYVPPPAAGAVAKGRMLAAPNILDPGDPATKVVFTFKGDPNGQTEIDIYDEARQYLGTLKGTIDSHGIGTVTITGLGVNGKKLGIGVYWAVARGGGVKDRRPFAVTRRKR